MKKIEKSGLYNTNTFAHVTLKAIEDIIGNNGLVTVLNVAGLEELIANIPPMNKEKAFDFADYSSINMAIEDIYGLRGGHVLAVRAGRATFNEFLKTYSAMVGMTDLAMRLIPLKTKMSLGLNAIAKVFNSVSDQKCVVEEQDDRFIFNVHRCPACWGREGAEKPICFMQIGLLKEGLRWLSNGKEFYVYEDACHAMGAEMCSFIVQKEPMGDR